VIPIRSNATRTASTARRTSAACAGSLLTEIIADAVRRGDLTLGGERRPADLAFILWSLAFGARALMNTQVAIMQLGIRDGFATARGFADDLMDALGWRPLTTEWDYGATRARIQRELFPEPRSPAAVSK